MSATVTQREMKWALTSYQIRATRDFGASTSEFTYTLAGPSGEPLVTGYVIGVYGKITQAFAGITGPVFLTIGNSDDSECNMASMNLLASYAGQELFSHRDTIVDYRVHICHHFPTYRHNMKTPILTFTSVSGNLSDLTAGEIEIVIPHLI